MKIEAKNIEEFFSQCNEKEKDIRQIHDLIERLAPSLKSYIFESDSITLLSYGTTISNNKAKTPWPIIGIAPQKQHISIYISAMKGPKTIIEAHQNNFPKGSTGKACIRIKKLRPKLHEALSNIIIDTLNCFER